MKNLTTKLMMAAAAMVSMAGLASAQTLEANVPFAFRANGKVLPAGTYRVHTNRTPSGAGEFVIQGHESGQHVLAVGFYDGEAKAAWKQAGNAVLQFECGVSRCALKSVWMGSGESVYSIPVPKLGKDEPRRTAEVLMHPAKGD